MRAWKKCSLGDVLELKRGYDLPAKQRRPGPVPIVSSSGRSGFHDEAKVSGPGVVTGRYGTLGEVFYVEEDFWPLNTALYVRDFKGNQPRFIAALLESLELSRRDGAAAVPGLNRNHLHLLPVTVPDLRTQAEIAYILSTLDDLIRNNHRRIALLEQMAQATYREAFVYFRYPGRQDGELVDSPLGPIPSTWELRPLFDEADVSFGYALKSRGFGTTGEWAVIRIRDIPAGRTETFTDEFPGPQYIVEDGDILIGMDGDFHLSRWSGGEALLNQRVTRIRAAGRLGYEGLYRALRAPIQSWNERIVGTTVAHLGKRHLEAIFLAVPPDQTAAALNAALDPMGESVLRLRKTNDRLTALRSVLLPKLVSGAMDVSRLDLDLLLDRTTA